MGRILWVDNDPPYIRTYVEQLEKLGHYVRVARTAIEAEVAIGEQEYDLLILDIMIPTKSAQEEEFYDPKETEAGLKTGLIFYRRNKGKLAKAKTQTLVLTVRLDRGILDEFTAEGLPRDCFARKLDLREISVFVERVSRVMNDTSLA